MDPQRYNHLNVFLFSFFISCFSFRFLPLDNSVLSDQVQNTFAFLTYQTHIILFTRESLGLLVLLGFDITALTPVAYLRHRL